MYKWSTNYDKHAGDIQQCTSEAQTTINMQVIYSNVHVRHKLQKTCKLKLINMQATNSNAQVKTHTAVKIQAIHTSEHKLQSTHKQ